MLFITIKNKLDLSTIWPNGNCMVQTFWNILYFGISIEKGIVHFSLNLNFPWGCNWNIQRLENLFLLLPCLLVPRSVTGILLFAGWKWAICRESQCFKLEKESRLCSQVDLHLNLHSSSYCVILMEPLFFNLAITLTLMEFL